MSVTTSIGDKAKSITKTSCVKTLSKQITIIGSDRVELAKHKLAGSSKTTLVAAIIASFGMVNFGFALEYAAPAIPQLMQPYMNNLRLREDSSAWFGSLVMIGLLLGGLLASFMVETYGRQTTIILLSVPSTVGWLLIMYATSVIWLYIGRIFTGIAAGIATVAISIYISEISPAETRGKLGSLVQMGITVGFTIGAAIGMAVNWNYLALIGQIIATILAFGTMITPETPRWLIANGYHSSAVNSLRWLRGKHAYIDYELAEIDKNLRNVETIKYRDLFCTSVRKPFLLAAILVVFQQLCGVNAVVPFCTYIFKEAGFDDSNLVNLIASTSQLVSCSLVYFLIERFGRVILLCVSGLGMAITCFAFGLYYQLTPIVSTDLSWLAMISVFIYFIAFNLGWGGLPFLVISEITPSRARGTVSGICACIGFFTGFLVSYGFIPLSNAITRQGIFWLYSGFNTLAVIFVYYCIPETKGKSLEEVESLLLNDNIVKKQVTQV